MYVTTLHVNGDPALATLCPTGSEAAPFPTIASALDHCVLHGLEGVVVKVSPSPGSEEQLVNLFPPGRPS